MRGSGIGSGELKDGFSGNHLSIIVILYITFNYLIALKDGHLIWMLGTRERQRDSFEVF